MENIYKIRVRSNPDPRGLYPSERRYSASTVLGLGVVHLALATTALLLASLSATVYQNQYLSTELIAEMKTNISAAEVPSSAQPEAPPPTTEEAKNETFSRMLKKRQVVEEMMPEEFNPSMNLSIAPSLMTLGALAAGLTGLLAWKRWYIDHNIRWFFCMSIVSTITSSVAFVLTVITVVLVTEHNTATISFWTLSNSNSNGGSSGEVPSPNRGLVLAYNILIAIFLELTWSLLSCKIAWIGMRADYPEDIINRSRGKVEVNTIHKGTKKGKIMPPDIISHFPVSGKIAKYFPRKETGNRNLPKAESNSEYMERVKKFLSSNPESVK